MSKLAAGDLVTALQILHPAREWVCFRELRLGTGYGGKWEQRIDLWAINCYPSHGLQSVAYEIKISRSDFLRELKEPDKRRAAMEMSNLFYFAAPGGLVCPDELPPDCGLVEVDAAGTPRVVHKAAFRDRLPVPWRFVAALARRVTGAESSPEFVDALAADLAGLGMDEASLLARTLSDAQSQIRLGKMTSKQAAAVLDRAAARLRNEGGCQNDHPRDD